MRKSLIVSAATLGVLALPALASAQTLQAIFATAASIINALVGLLFTLAIVAFFWGLVRYLFKTDAEGKSGGLKIMMYGILAIFVMASLYGIVGILQRTVGASGNSQFTAPSVVST